MIYDELIELEECKIDDQTMEEGAGWYALSACTGWTGLYGNGGTAVPSQVPSVLHR